MTEDYICVDLEMTGVHPNKDSIIEIGAVKVKDGQRKEFSALIRPRHAVPPEVEKLTGITNELLSEEGRDTDEVMEEFMAFEEGLPLIGHMISCDYGFLKQWAINHRMTYERKGIDTLMLSRKFYPDLPKKTLDYMTEYLGIERKNNHRALEDAIATEKLYRILKESFEKGNEKDFIPKELRYKGKRQTPATSRQIEYIKDYCREKGIGLPEDIDVLTRSEASRLVDKLIEKHGKLSRPQ